MKPIVQKVIAGGILLHEGKVLIVQRSADDTYPGLWEVPSGKKEELELIETTIKREFKEEAGIEIEPVKPISVFNFKVEKDTEIRDATQINFLVKATGPIEVKLSSEHQASAWVTDEEIDNYAISPETKQSLLAAFKA